MTEEENISVEESVPQEAVAAATESDSSNTESASATEERRKRNDVEYNWAEARRKMQELERQNRDMAEKVAKMTQPPRDLEEDELDKLADDDIITKGHAKKMAEKMARQIANEVIKQRENANVDERLQVKFPDFGEVVTPENIEILKQNEPELALTLYHNPDPYSQGVAAYKLLKKIGAGQTMAQSTEKKKALENSQKPVSVNAVSKNSAIGNAHLFENGLTPELKKSLWKEMEDARKRM